MTLTARQQEIRVRGLGGSDVAAVAGLDPYRGPHDVWMEKMGLVPPFEGNRFTHWGNRLEGVMADEYAERFGVHLRTSDTIVHPSRPWMLGTPDRLVFTSPKRRKPEWGLECKARSIHRADEWGESGTDEVPYAEAAQCFWYMELTGHERWDVAVLIAGNDFRHYTLHQRRDVIEPLLAIAEKFWRDHVEAKVPPPVDARESSRRYLAQVFPDHDAEIVEAPAELAEVAARLAEAKARLKATEDEIALAENLMKEAIGDHAGIKGPWGKATWKRTKSGGVDWKAAFEDLLSSVTADEATRARTRRRMEELHTRPGYRRLLFTPAKED